MCHKPVQIIISARMCCDIICLTIYNEANLFKNFNEIYKCEHKFYEIFNDLNTNYYNCTDGMSDEILYDLIIYKKKEKSLIIFDRNTTIIYDSRAGFLDLV